MKRLHPRYDLLPVLVLLALSPQISVARTLTAALCGDLLDEAALVSVRDAQSLVSTLQSSVTLKLYPNSGFASSAELIAALENADPMTREIWKRLRDEEVDFCMNAPAQARTGILTSGEFKNKWDPANSTHTGKPGGYPVEHVMTNTPKDTYQELDPSVKIKYGYLRSRVPGDISPDVRDSYGEDMYVFKKDKLRERTTFWPRDTLSVGGTGLGSHIPFESRRVEHHLMPWENRELLAAIIASTASKSDPVRVFPRKVGESWESPVGIILNRDMLPAALRSFKVDAKLMTSNYTELQYFGRLGLDDVEAFYFTSEPPKGAFLRELMSRGIPIYDARGKAYEDAILWVSPRR